MNATELRAHVLEALKDGRAIGNADMPKSATPYAVKRVMAQLVDEGAVVTRLLPGGKTRLFFKDDKTATQYLRQYASNLTPLMGSIKFDASAEVKAVAPSVCPSVPYSKLSSAHTSSGYVASV